jgi:hypothetical protein
MKRLALITVYCLLSCPPAGLAADMDMLKRFDIRSTPIKVYVQDHVKDGCLPSPNRLVEVAESELQRLGFKIQTDQGASSRLKISALGYRATGVPGEPQQDCLVTLNLSLDIYAYYVLGTEAPALADLESSSMAMFVEAFENHYFSSSSSNVQQQAERNVKATIEELYLEVQ